MTTTMTMYEATQILTVKVPEARQVILDAIHITTRLDEHGVVYQHRCVLCPLAFAARSPEAVKGTLALHLEQDH